MAKKKQKQKQPHPADCGLTFAHDWHSYRTPRKKVKVCDGSINKRENNG